MSKFNFWDRVLIIANLIGAALNLGLFVFGRHVWFSLAMAVAAVASALWVYFSARNRIAVMAGRR